MTKLVLLATVFIILHGFAGSYPSGTLNQPTRIDNQIGQDSQLDLEAVRDGIDYIFVYKPTSQDKIEEKLVKEKKNFINKESESIENKNKNTWKSKIDQLNKWRLPRMENQNLPRVFILRTNEYKK